MPASKLNSSPETVRLQINGMHCSACVVRVEKALDRVEGVASAEVNFATHSATVHLEQPVPVGQLQQALTSIGYSAEPIQSTFQQHQEEGRSFPTNLAVSAVLTIPIVAISMGMHVRPEWLNWLLIAGGAVVVLVCGRGFIARGFPALFRGAPTMDSLVALGTTAALAISIIYMVLHRGMPMHQSMGQYIETGAVIVTLILLGKHLEERSKKRMGRAIAQLLSLFPKTARRRESNGEWETVPFNRLVGRGVQAASISAWRESKVRCKEFAAWSRRTSTAWISSRKSQQRVQHWSKSRLRSL